MKIINLRLPNQLFLLLFSLVLFSCSNKEKASDNNQSVISNKEIPQTEHLDSNSDQYTAISIFTDSIGWGYQILNNGTPFVNQPHIPAIKGVKGFENEVDALKTADLAIHKIKSGIVPPTITIKELDSLGVL